MRPQASGLQISILDFNSAARVQHSDHLPSESVTIVNGAVIKCLVLS